MNNRLTPALFVRAAERVGLSARVVKRPLARISPMVLPAVLLFRDGQACVLTGLHGDGAAEVMFPETGLGVTRTTLDDLAARYSGYAVFVKPVYRQERATTPSRGARSRGFGAPCGGNGGSTWKSSPPR